MSRNNNDLPMLPPWLSESDVTQTGYEAPVQNLPHEELIPEESGSRRLFGRKSDAEADKKKRKSWRKDKGEAVEPHAEGAPPASPSWAPPASPMPTDHPPAPDAFRNNGFQPPAPSFAQPPTAQPEPQPHAGPASGELPATYRPAEPPDAPDPHPTTPPPVQPPIPPAPQALSHGVTPTADAEMTVRVPRRPDLPPPPPQQQAPTPPPLPDWSQAASRAPEAPTAQRSGPPPRLGVPEGYESDASRPAPTAAAHTGPATGEMAAPEPAVAAPQTGQPPHASATEATSSVGEQVRPAEAESGLGPSPQGAGADEEVPDWLGRGPVHPGPATGAHPTDSGTGGPAPGPAFSTPPDRAVVPTLEGPVDGIGTAHSSPISGTTAPAPAPTTHPDAAAARDNSMPPVAAAPDTAGTNGAQAQPSARSSADAAEFGPNTGTSADAAHADPQWSGQHRMAAPVPHQQPPYPPTPPDITTAQGPMRAPESVPGPQSGAIPISSAPSATGPMPQAPEAQGPIPVGPYGVSQPRIPRPPMPIADEQAPTPAPVPHSNPIPYQADPRYAPPDAQWQAAAQAPPAVPSTGPTPGPQQQWSAPQPQPDQYSQPQQYARPNPYTQGAQYVSPPPQQPAPEQYQPPQYQPPQYQQADPYQGSPQQYPPNGAATPSLEDVPMRRAKKAPGSGWRRAVHHMSGGAINPGMSAEERRLQELVARIRQPVRGDYRIATLSLKGGVGKTTTTMGIGSIFASIRGDRVIAVDANPDFGTLSQRVPLQTRSTVRDLLLDQTIRSYGDVRRHTSQATSRLEVLASERDPAASESFSEDEYRQVLRVLQRFYNIILTDCGTGLMHSAMAGVLDLAHSLVLISSSAIDGARSAAATLDWLSLHGHDHLVRNAVVVINLPREGSPNVAIQHLREYFLARCRAVHVIPYDPHLAEGAEIDLARLHKNTKRALVELAATVADDFATDHRRFGGY